MPTLMRIFKRDHTTNINTPTQIIIVKFIANHIRSDFYNRYLKKIAGNNPIKSENINFPEGKQIMISENLTVKNSGIFVAASKLKREKKLSSVFTHNGLVHVKANKTDKACTIHSQRQLEVYTNVIEPMEIQNQANDNNSMAAATGASAATAAHLISFSPTSTSQRNADVQL